jgi:TonB family protein
MTTLATAVSGALIHFVWQGSIVGLVLWAVLLALSKHSARSRYAASCAAMALMAVLPVVTAWRLYGRSAAARSGRELLASFSLAIQTVPAGTHPQQAMWLAWLQFWALPVWSVGVLLCSARLVLGYQHAFRLRRCGSPAGVTVAAVVNRLANVMGVYRPIRVLMSSITDTPSVVGWLRPVILLPAATLIGLTPLQLEAVLAHEIGHIKRYDYLVNMLQMLAETLLFYHPAVWWTSKRIRVERELCCDDLAVQFSGNALRYARALTTLEKLRVGTPGVAMASTGGPLLYRIRRLAGLNTKEYGPSRLPAVLAAGLGLFCIALNVSWVRAQDAQGVNVDLRGSPIIHRSPVAYPEVAAKKGITGTVQLEVTLDADGNVADAHVLSGPAELRKASLESVLNWHFAADAARSTRLVDIGFSDQGKQVQVTSPPAPPFTAVVVQTDGTGTARLEFQADAQQKQSEALTRRQKLERAMDQTKAQIAEADRNGEPDSMKSKLQAEFQELRREFESTPMPQRSVEAFRGIRVGEAGPREIAGRPLRAIDASRLPESVRNDLLSKLPVRVGEPLSLQLIKLTEAAVRGFDEHLRYEFVATPDGQADLLIIVPGSERR